MFVGHWQLRALTWYFTAVPLPSSSAALGVWLPSLPLCGWNGKGCVCLKPAMLLSHVVLVCVPTFSPFFFVAVGTFVCVCVCVGGGGAFRLLFVCQDCCHSSWQKTLLAFCRTYRKRPAVWKGCRSVCRVPLCSRAFRWLFLGARMTSTSLLTLKFAMCQCVSWELLVMNSDLVPSAGVVLIMEIFRLWSVVGRR